MSLFSDAASEKTDIFLIGFGSSVKYPG